MQLVLFLLAAHFSRCPALIPVCNPAAPAAANHDLFVLCNIGMKMPDSRAGACDSSNVPDKSLLMILSCFSLPVHIYRRCDNAVTVKRRTCSDKTSSLVRLRLSDFQREQRDIVEKPTVLRDLLYFTGSKQSQRTKGHQCDESVRLQNRFLCSPFCCKFLKITSTL